MGLFAIFGAVSPVHIWFVTLMTGAKKIGTDSEGNKYYQTKARKGYNHPRRWVIYNGEADASRVPPEWHGWLHYQTDEYPTDSTPSFRRVWQAWVPPSASPRPEFLGVTVCHAVLLKQFWEASSLSVH